MHGLPIVGHIFVTKTSHVSDLGNLVLLEQRVVEAV